MKTVTILSGVLALFFLAACGPSGTGSQTVTATDPLPSWNEGDTKQAILDFVGRVTDPASPDFVAEAERIATFDNDGTLWAEKPVYLSSRMTWRPSSPPASMD